MSLLSDVPHQYARTLPEDTELALRLLSSQNMDGLLLCCRQHPLNLLKYLLSFLAVSRPFAVYCPYKEVRWPQWRTHGGRAPLEPEKHYIFRVSSVKLRD